MSDNQFICPPCGEKFQSEEELDSHAKQMHSKTEEHQEEHAITCSKCGFKANAEDQMEDHNKGHMGASQM